MILQSAGKMMVTLFWDKENILLKDSGVKITGNRYADLLNLLKETVEEKRREHGPKGAFTQLRSRTYELCCGGCYSWLFFREP